MEAISLAALEDSDWFNMRGFCGDPVVVSIKITGSGQATLRVSNDDSNTTKDDIQSWVYSASTILTLPAPLPNFLQVGNTGASGTVVFAISNGVQHITAPPPPME